MPLYEYRCDACEHQFEVIQRFSDDPISVCPACGSGPVVKLLSSPAIQFKGSGWYITDYARKGQSGGESKPGGEGKTDSKEKGGESARSAGDAPKTPAAPAASPGGASTPAKD